MVFLHLPFEHREFIILHSFISTVKSRATKTGEGHSWNNTGGLCSLWTVQYLWGRVCRWWSHPCARSLDHGDTAGCTLESPFLDIRHIQGPRRHPLSSSRRPRGAFLGREPHSARPHGWGNTAPYAGLKVTNKVEYQVVWIIDLMQEIIRLKKTWRWHQYHCTFTVPTNARPAADVNSHSWRALAEKGAWCVDALAIDTHSGKHLTFIHIWQSVEKTTTSRTGPEFHIILMNWTF